MEVGTFRSVAPLLFLFGRTVRLWLGEGGGYGIVQPQGITPPIFASSPRSLLSSWAILPAFPPHATSIRTLFHPADFTPANRTPQSHNFFS
ncbi:hypothetical protein KSP39_PZI021052 [Platanthera zijinensis]|uniref:Secreted protein n=1 Tax=Platanthera zijinensis TaxID=2320716 RepID=A0AAP0AXX0_9ASPA